MRHDPIDETEGDIEMSENIFAQMLQRYSGDPAGWVRDMVGIEVDEWQASVMDQVAQRSWRQSIWECPRSAYIPSGIMNDGGTGF